MIIIVAQTITNIAVIVYSVNFGNSGVVYKTSRINFIMFLQDFIFRIL